MCRFYLADSADTLPQYLPLPRAVTGYLGRIAVTLDPATLGRPYLERGDLAVLQIIKDELGRRPIYFSASTGSYADQLGLSAHLVGEGLVRRVVPRPVAPDDSVRLVQGRGFVNVPRSRALAFGGYRGGATAARPRPRGWVDVPSQNSLFGYVFVYDTMAAGLHDVEAALAARAGELRDAILAHAWGLLPLAAGYAMRINLLAAATSAVAAGCWFLVGERLMRAWVPAVWPRRLAALAGAVCAATAFTVWNQSVVNEKVYTLSLLSVALVLWLILRWDDQPLGEAHDHHLLLIVYLIALTATNHMMGVLVGPVVVILLLPPLKAQRPPDDASRREEWSQWFLFCSVYAMIVATGLESSLPLKAAGVLFLAALANSLFRARNWDFALAVLGVAVAGLSVYLFLPIRSAHFPPINEGEPTSGQALWDVLTRQQYGKPPVSQRQAPIRAQVGVWVQDLSWPWGRGWMGGLQRGVAGGVGGRGLV